MDRKPIPLISEPEIQKRVSQLARKISQDHPRGLIAIGVLKGSYVFMADLLRRLSVPVFCDFLMVSSYRGARSQGEVRLVLDLSLSIEGQDVVLVEDIIDTGLTLHFLKKMLLARRPRSLKVCCLLDKPSRREIPLGVDYVGFAIPDRFVVGYGIDHNGRYRNLPYVAYVKVRP
jgi:hypoxanthine phosphoribosyltransferase